MFTRSWIACSKYDKHSRLNSQCIWLYLYEHWMATKIDNPYFITFLIRTPHILVICGVVWSKERIVRYYVFKRDWIAWSTYDNHSRLNSHHIWLDLFDHFMGTRLVIGDWLVNFVFICPPKIMKEVVVAFIWIC